MSFSNLIFRQIQYAYFNIIPPELVFLNIIREENSLSVEKILDQRLFIFHIVFFANNIQIFLDIITEENEKLKGITEDAKTIEEMKEFVFSQKKARGWENFNLS